MLSTNKLDSLDSLDCLDCLDSLDCLDCLDSLDVYVVRLSGNLSPLAVVADLDPATARDQAEQFAETYNRHLLPGEPPAVVEVMPLLLTQGCQ